MSIRNLLLAGSSLIAASLGVGIQAANAGTVILEGSDAIGYHSNVNAGAATYRDQAYSAIGGADPRPIAVLGTGTFGPIVSGTHAIVQFATTAAAGDLSQYVALDFLAFHGCCDADLSLVVGHEADIAAYLTAGGTIMIQNYGGEAAWDFAVGTTGGAAPGKAFDIGCSDGETVTATGLANGFTQPPVMNCWTHQSYDVAYFLALGFDKNFFNSPGSTGAFSSLLANGTTETGCPGCGGGESSVPEPTTLALFGAGLAGLGTLRRRKAAK